MPLRLAILTFIMLFSTSAPGQTPVGSFVLDFDPRATHDFTGVVGERVRANTKNWILRAPAANPGMLAMFRLRDREPAPELVPWAGEFAGKYLISAVQACRMDSDPSLRQYVKQVFDELILCQAEDGYLGPFPKQDRLLKHWDLWGHYHIMLALLMWHEQTNDPTALFAARKAANLACQIYLEGDRRPRDAGSTEMNLAIIHALGRLYRVTKDERHLALMREIEKDWEAEGDYLRTGLAGTEFYETPKPRWESLHDLQGLVELYLITGDPRYRRAFLNHWHSIQRLDRRNTGGFSSGEQATGTPYEPTAIETCCTIAWMAMSVDALRLSGVSQMADELERSTFNGMLGAQHPSGYWWTYNTPMDGVREASHDTIVFQSRAGTPDLNCCSVNAPRGLGMLSQWAVMRHAAGLTINYYGPMETRLKLHDGFPVTIRQQTKYPLEGKVSLQPQIDEAREFDLRLRIPGWSRRSTVRCLNQDGEILIASSDAGDRTRPQVIPGEYFSVERMWSPGDVIELEFDMSLRYEAGGGPVAGKASVFRGPLLLAYDLLLNSGASAPHPVTPADLSKAHVSFPLRTSGSPATGQFPPWVLVDIRKSEGEVIRLCDFASAGSRGNAYLSWLPARQIAPPPPVPLSPTPGASVPAGRMLFSARPDASDGDGQRLTVIMSEEPDFRRPILQYETDETDRVLIPAQQTAALQADVTYYWKLVASNQWGRAESIVPPRRLSIDPALPPLSDEMLTRFGENSEGLITAAKLAGTPDPSYGSLVKASGWKATGGIAGKPEGAVELDGQAGMLTYRLKAFPGHQYSVSLWCMPLRVEGGLGQIFSAWSRGMDDPLRVCVQKGKLSARIEAGRVFATNPVSVQKNQWYHVCVVKEDDQLTIYLDGQQIDTISVPPKIRSSARDFALGGNPHYTGSSEHLACRVAQLKFWARALSDQEVARASVPNPAAGR